MEGVVEIRRKRFEEGRDGFDLDDREKGGSCTDLVDEDCKGRSSTSETSMSEPTISEEMLCPSGSESSSSPRPAWLIQKAEKKNCSVSHLIVDQEKNCLEDGKCPKQNLNISEIEMIKERLSKLLLGEDMSGSGEGVCTALAISNAITNLCATLFGQVWRLEPLSPEKKSMWKREMELLLCVSDHIVEMIPSWQTCPDGRKVEVMNCRPRSDLYMNLPALRKLDSMLLDILDSFSKAKFWYADQGLSAPESDGSASFRRSVGRKEKWWLPIPGVPPGGLDDESRKNLQHKRDCTNQILKAAIAINNTALAEMDVPESYLEALPKYGRASLGDVIHRYISSDQFNPDLLLDCLDLSSEHQALEFVNRVEASLHIWRRRTYTKSINNVNNRFNPRSSWEIVKDFVIDLDKREVLADKAESLLLCLKHRFPGLPQTALDTSKIQYNKDVGKSILEAYSRVLESIAFNIVARIDDLLYADDLAKNSDKKSPVLTVTPKKRVLPLPCSVSILSTHRASATPCFSPAPLFSPATVERRPLINGKSNQGFSVKKVLIDYFDVKGKNNTSNAVRDLVGLCEKTDS